MVAFDPSTTRSYTNRHESDDEADQGIARKDVFPNYILRDESSPVTYFDSRTYASFSALPNPAPAAPPTPLPAATVVFNAYERTLASGETEVLRPVMSNIAGDPPTTIYGTQPAAVAAWQFMNPRTYQLFAPGLDGRYGDVGDVDGGDIINGAAAYFQIDGFVIIANENGTSAESLKLTTVSRFDVSADQYIGHGGAGRWVTQPVHRQFLQLR